MRVDLFELVRTAGTVSSALPLAQATRIETPRRDGALAWTASARPDPRPATGAVGRLDLSIDGDVTLVCQRCLQPLVEPIALRSQFVVATDEASAEALDDDDAFDVVTGAPDFDLDLLVEDEVLLALPIAARHEVCPEDPLPGSDDRARPSPFAILGGWKRDR